MSITDLITDWRFAILAYGLTGLAMVMLHSGIRRTALGGSNSLRLFVATQRIVFAIRCDTDDLAWQVHLRIYVLAVILVGSAIVAWPVLVFSRWQEIRLTRKSLRELDVLSGRGDLATYASELSAQESRESFDALWRAKIPEGRQDDLPRFIHFRHTVAAFDEAIGKRSLFGTLVRDENAYRGEFTLYQWSRAGMSPETIISVRLSVSDVRKLMAALRSVRLLREVPPSRARMRRSWQRFHLIRRLAISAPDGCSPCLFEMESDEISHADARWDCVNYVGWAVDSVHARNSNNAWLIQDDLEQAYEDLVVAMDVRQHLTRMPHGVAALFTKVLG